MSNVLKVSNLRLSFPEGEVLKGIDLEISPGETVGLVGESGAGKSMLTLAIMGLLPAGAKIKNGRIEFLGQDILSNPARQSAVRGRQIGIIFQDPAASLDPLYRVGCQVAETFPGNVLKIFSLVEFRNPESMAFRYPHQISGGEKQRVMIAIALSGKPSLLLADEPTASLDVNTGHQILLLLKRIQKEMGLSILFISHNLPLVERIADKIAIIYAGKILEKGETQELVTKPLHPYTRLLYAARPDPVRKGTPLATVPGYPKEASQIPDGCVFYNRCPRKDPACLSAESQMVEASPGHWVACHRSKHEVQN